MRLANPPRSAIRNPLWVALAVLAGVLFSMRFLDLAAASGHLQRMAGTL